MFPYGTVLLFRFCRLIGKMPCPVCAKQGHPGNVRLEGWNGNGHRLYHDVFGHGYIWCKRYRCHDTTHGHTRPLSYLSFDPKVMLLMPEVSSASFQY